MLTNSHGILGPCELMGSPPEGAVSAHGWVLISSIVSNELLPED